jgi:hypothetical protein
VNHRRQIDTKTWSFERIRTFAKERADRLEAAASPPKLVDELDGGLIDAMRSGNQRIAVDSERNEFIKCRAIVQFRVSSELYDRFFGSRTGYRAQFWIAPKVGQQFNELIIQALRSTLRIRIAENDLGGIVSGQNGPEAGVWVIAETTDLPTPFTKVVVTDDGRRYVIPDLPKANYKVWARGYGLVDSAKTETPLGKIVNLSAMPAPTAAAAAEHYPPIYWFSLMRVPGKSEFPLPKIKSQGEWLTVIKSGACQSCHPLGTPGMRRIGKELGEFQNSADAWEKRLQAGSAMNRSYEF